MMKNRFFGRKIMFFSSPKSRDFQNFKISDFHFFFKNLQKSSKISRIFAKFFLSSNCFNIYFYRIFLLFFLSLRSGLVLSNKHVFDGLSIDLKNGRIARSKCSYRIHSDVQNSRPPLKRYGLPLPGPAVAR